MTMTTTNQNQQVQRQKGPTLRDFLNSPTAQAKLAEVAKAHMKAEDLTRMALMALSRQPDLAKCSQTSILRALIDAAELGIKPGGLMGRGYLVPRKNRKNGELECHFDPGYRGLVDIARRSGQVRRLEAHVVHEKDVFELEYGDEPRLLHKPTLIGDPGQVIAAYAVAQFADGSKQVEVLTRREIDKVKASSASQNGPWSNWYDEMAKKTAVRRICKLLPFSDELERALLAAGEVDDEGPAPVEVIDGGKSRGKSLAGRIAARSEANMAPDIDLSVGDDGDADEPPHDADGVIADAAERQPGDD